MVIFGVATDGARAANLLPGITKAPHNLTKGKHDMYTIAQIEQANAAIHNQGGDTPQALARMKAISDIYLNALAAGVARVEQESLTEQEIEMINHFLK